MYDLWKPFLADYSFTKVAFPYAQIIFKEYFNIPKGYKALEETNSITYNKASEMIV